MLLCCFDVQMKAAEAPGGGGMVLMQAAWTVDGLYDTCSLTDQSELNITSTIHTHSTGGDRKWNRCWERAPGQDAAACRRQARDGARGLLIGVLRAVWTGGELIG